jgi:hypothetical protein
MSEPTPIIEDRNLKKHFNPPDGVIAVKDVSFEICRAKFLACSARTEPGSYRYQHDEWTPDADRRRGDGGWVFDHP